MTFKTSRVREHAGTSERRRETPRAPGWWPSQATTPEAIRGDAAAWEGRRAATLSPVALALAVVCLAASARAERISPDALARVKAAEADRIAAIDRVFGSVVAVYRGAGQGGGSGVVIHPDGFALTNFHVVRAAGKQGKAGLADGNLYDWSLYGMDPGGDLAVIRLKGSDAFPAAPLGDSRSVRVGDWALAMGNPFVLAEDQRPTVTLGVVSGVERFQHGLGGRSLVYGNCIQIDTSINPGNSGGPLFDIGGRLIGINGRGSFEERGRVNVGVGYAISIEQARNFLPDLLATKVCQHGTLDATFIDGRKGVICDAVNIDSPIGKMGLRPGDELVAFDGRRIQTANAFLNRISTYPAKWPVEVAFRHDGRPVSGWVRLTPLPYGQPVRLPGRMRPPRAVPVPRPDRPEKEDKAGEAPEQNKAEKPAEPPPEDADRGEGADEKPDDEPDRERTVRVEPEGPALTPGDIMDAEKNREACRWLLAQYVAFLGGREAVDRAGAVRCEVTCSRKGREVGRMRWLEAADGRFRVERVAGEAKGSAEGWDGTRFWRRPDASKPAEVVEGDAARAHRFVAVTRALAALTAANPLERFEEIELEGGDRACRRRAFRLRVRQADSPACVFWFSAFDDRGALEVRLVKAARASEAAEDGKAITFGEYRTVQGLKVPHRRRTVAGLDERVREEMTVTGCTVLEEPPPDAFDPPAEPDAGFARRALLAEPRQAYADVPRPVLPGRASSRVPPIACQSVLPGGKARFDKSRRAGMAPARPVAGIFEPPCRLAAHLVPRPVLPGRASSRVCSSGGAIPASSHVAAADANPFAEAIRFAQKRCAKIYGGGAGREHGYATGLLVSPDGLILTAQGMYLAEGRLRVILPDGSRHEAEVVRRSESLQAALLRVKAATPDHFALAGDSPVEPGDWVVAVSNAYNVAGPMEPLAVNVGIVSLRAEIEARHRAVDVPYEGEVLLVDAITSNPGAPGGALMTADGRLAGMVGKLFRSSSTNTRINYAVPVELLRGFVAAEPAGETAADAETGEPYLGIRLFTLSGKRAPAYVDRVASGSPAAEAGVRKDDLILSLGRTRVSTCEAYDEALAELVPGRPVGLLLKRGRQVLTVTVTPTRKEDRR